MTSKELFIKLREYKGTDCYIVLASLVETCLNEVKQNLLFSPIEEIPKLQGRGQFLEQMKKELLLQDQHNVR